MYVNIYIYIYTTCTCVCVYIYIYMYISELPSLWPMAISAVMEPMAKSGIWEGGQNEFQHKHSFHLALTDLNLALVVFFFFYRAR